MAKVLIVDDNPDIIGLLRANFRMAGFETDEALNGEVALRRIEEDRPDLIVLDLMMPVLDGWGVLEALQDRPDRPPVVVVTAAESEGTVERTQELGVSGYVTKPFNLTALVDLVRSVIEGTESRSNPAGSAHRGRP
jgi:DNA-binding response OmpR family regulator